MTDPQSTLARAAPFSAATLDRFAREIAKYPADQKQSAVMACLAIVQHEQGHVSTAAEDGIAAYLGMAPIAVHEVTTFYNMYNQQPVGRYKLNVCTNLPCALRDGDKALDHLCQRLGVEPYGTTADGTLHRAAQRVPGRLRRRAGDAGQRPRDAQLHERRAAGRTGRHLARRRQRAQRDAS